MNEEVKEILEDIDEIIKVCPNKGTYGISHKKWRKILDYITNLQEENKDLKYSNIYLSKTCDKYKILQDYKLRNEKAIEQLFELKDIIYKPETRNENIEIQRKISSIIINLKGSDKE